MLPEVVSSSPLTRSKYSDGNTNETQLEGRPLKEEEAESKHALLSNGKVIKGHIQSEGERYR